MRTFDTSWGEFTPTVEDVLVMFHLPIFANENGPCFVRGRGEECATAACYPQGLQQIT